MNNMMLYAKCLKQYINTMKKHIEEKASTEDKPYFDISELENIHKLTKESSLERVNSNVFFKIYSNVQ